MSTDRLGNNSSETVASYERSQCSIHDLPVEILIRIFYNLDPLQLNTTRLVCKRWNFAISDKSTWTYSFKRKFKTPTTSFPSISCSSGWMMEYFARVAVMKKWNKGEATHHTYLLPNSELQYVDRVFADFRSFDGMGRIMTYSERIANVATARLQDGRNQGFIDGGNLSSMLVSCDLNWNYLVVGRTSGDLIVKNLLTSTASAYPSTQTFSDTTVEETGNPVISVLINTTVDKNKEKVDIISGHLSGILTLWTLAGKIVRKFQLNGPIINIKSDFKEFIVCNTLDRCYIIGLSDANILQTFNIGKVSFDDETLRNYPTYFGNPVETRRNTLEVDFGGGNIIVIYKAQINVYNFKSALQNIKPSVRINVSNENTTIDSECCFQNVIYDSKCLTLENEVYQTKIQTQFRLHSKRNTDFAGKDGLLCANVLDDNSVIVWGVRDDEINILCKIFPEFSKYAPDISNHSNLNPITSLDLNSSVIAIGSYNGFVNIYNVFSGEFIREASTKPPKKYQFHEIVPVNKVIIDSNERNASGVIVTGQLVQYFQFGKKSVSSNDSSSRKKPKTAGGLKRIEKQKIKDEMDDFDNDRWMEEKRNQLFQKFNGGNIDEEDELSVALALSQSVHSLGPDEDLQRALEESERLQKKESSSQVLLDHDTSLDEDEQLRRILEWSLHDQ